MNSSLIMTFIPRANSVLLNENILDALGHPKFIQIYINPKARLLLFHASTARDKDTHPIPKPFFSHYEIKNRQLILSVRRIAGWRDNMLRTFEGVYIPNHQSVCFSIDDSEIIGSVHTQEKC